MAVIFTQGDAETRFAMKTLEKREMVERNKVEPQLYRLLWGESLLLQCMALRVGFADLIMTF